MKYISAEQLIDIVTECKDKPFKKSSIYAILTLMPSADVRENIHGEWIRTNPLTDTFECSLCGMQIPVLEMCSTYCPLCGADMRGELNDNKG